LAGPDKDKALGIDLTVHFYRPDALFVTQPTMSKQWQMIIVIKDVFKMTFG